MLQMLIASHDIRRHSLPVTLKPTARSRTPFTLAQPTPAPHLRATRFPPADFASPRGLPSAASGRPRSRQPYSDPPSFLPTASLQRVLSGSNLPPRTLPTPIFPVRSTRAPGPPGPHATAALENGGKRRPPQRVSGPHSPRRGAQLLVKGERSARVHRWERLSSRLLPPPLSIPLLHSSSRHLPGLATERTPLRHHAPVYGSTSRAPGPQGSAGFDLRMCVGEGRGLATRSQPGASIVRGPGWLSRGRSGPGVWLAHSPQVVSWPRCSQKYSVSQHLAEHFVLC